MSETEIFSSEQLDQFDNDQQENSDNDQQENSDNDQQENSDFVDWINGFTFEENFHLNYQFDKWQLFCSLFWIIIFVICTIIFILLLRK